MVNQNIHWLDVTIHDPTAVKEVESTNDAIQDLCPKSVVEEIVLDKIRDTPVAHERHKNAKIATGGSNISIASNKTVMTMILIELLLSQKHLDLVEALVSKEVAAILVINKRNMAIGAAAKRLECDELAWIVFAKWFFSNVEESRVLEIRGAIIVSLSKVCHHANRARVKELENSESVGIRIFHE